MSDEAQVADEGAEAVDENALTYGRENVFVVGVADSAQLKRGYNALAKGFGVTPEVVTYLLAKGFGQSMSEAANMSADERTACGSEDAVKAEKVARQEQRLADLLAGNVPSRSGARGPKLEPIELIRREIAEGEIAMVAKNKDVEMPKGKELTELRNRYYARHQERIDEIAGAELARREAIANDDVLADLIGEVEEAA